MTEPTQDDRRMDRYRHLVEQAEDMLYLLDAEGRYELVNDSMAELTGYDKAELIGESPAKLLADGDLKEGQKRIQHLLESDREQTDTWTVTLMTKDGKRVPCELRFTLLPFQNGEYNGIVGVARDIRERKRREQKLSVMTRVLRHNIRNKLGLVMGKADLLNMKVDEEGIDASPEEIDETTRQIERTASEMVTLSEKVRTIQERIRSQPEGDIRTDVARLARDVAQQFRASEPDATIEFTGPGEAWAAVSDSYEVAVSELIENGLTHHDGEGDATVAVELRDRRIDGIDYVETVVTDRCPRIPENEKRVIREERETDLSHSAGVGLWLVYWVVQAVGGEIDFDYDGRGNRVTLRFEAAEPV